MDNEFSRKLFEKWALTLKDLEVYLDQTAAFRRKFGREMGPGDPFFFDPDAETPQFRGPGHAYEAIDLLARLMADMGIDQAEIYAFKKTRGLFPTRNARLTPDELEEWTAAAQEYRAKLHRTATQ